MKAVPKATLIRELRQFANAKGGKPLEMRMADLAQWYFYHMGEIPLDNLAAKASFLERAFWIQIEINALLIERMHEAGKRGSQKLWLPSGMTDGTRDFS